MLKLSICICDTDKEYLKALGRYFLSVKQYQFSINLFEKKENLSQFLETNSTDILLLSEQLYNEEAEYKKTEMTVILIEGLLSNTCINLPWVEKYIKPERILEKIIRLYSGVSKKEIPSSDSKKQALIIGVFSPAGGCGKTAISLKICEVLSKIEKQVLFLSLEGIPSYKKQLNIFGDKSITDLFYFINLGAENILMRVEGVLAYSEEKNLWYLPPPLDARDMESIREEEWERLIELIATSGRFRFIVIDFTSEVSERNLRILDKCDKKLFIASKRELGEDKLDIFLEQTKQENFIVLENEFDKRLNGLINEIESY